MRMVLSCALLLYSCSAFAGQSLLLWPDREAPYAKAAEDLEHVDPDCWGGVPCARQVTTPTLTLYAADPPSRQWLLIAPGGGYESVAIEHEGAAIAQAFAARGISAAVLKYRIPDPRTATHPERVPLADLHRAMALLRAQQRAAGVAGQIGVVGFSAGGHLAAFAMVNPHVDAALNPDFALLIYGVSEFTAANEQWLEESLYYRPLSAAERAREQILERVRPDTPPAFLVHALDDTVTPVTESTRYAEALTAAGVPAEVHLFATGGHGFGAGLDRDGTSQWLDLATDWIRRRAR